MSSSAGGTQTRAGLMDNFSERVNRRIVLPDASPNFNSATPESIVGRESARRRQKEIENARGDVFTDTQIGQFNDEIFKLAQSLTGQAAGVSQVFDPDSLSFIGGDDRGGELNRLVNLFQRRQQEITQRRLEPGNSQTRLSLVE